jgi:hypothetical protein
MAPKGQTTGYSSCGRDHTISTKTDLLVNANQHVLITGLPPGDQDMFKGKVCKGLPWEGAIGGKQFCTDYTPVLKSM